MLDALPHSTLSVHPGLGPGLGLHCQMKPKIMCKDANKLTTQNIRDISIFVMYSKEIKRKRKEQKEALTWGSNKD